MARAKSKKKWSRLAPKTRQERRELLSRCGRDAFLDPGPSNERMAFPVVAKSGSCKPSCVGIRAALSRAKQFNRGKVLRKATGLVRKYGC